MVCERVKLVISRRADRAPGRCRAGGGARSAVRAPPAALLTTGLSNAFQEPLVPEQEEVADPAAVLVPPGKYVFDIVVAKGAAHPDGAVPFVDAFGDPPLVLHGVPGLGGILGQVDARALGQRAVLRRRD